MGAYSMANAHYMYTYMYSMMYLERFAGDLVDLSECDPNVVASLLKLYLRDLPEPIIPPRLLMKTESCTSECWSGACLTLYMYSKNNVGWPESFTYTL